MALKALLAGDWSALGDIQHALVGHPEIELAEADVDAIVFAASAPAPPLAALAEVRARVGAPVVLLAATASEALLETAERYGIAEILVAPQPAENVVFALRKAARSKPAPAEAQTRAGVVRTVFSPKGGTGKTATACSLAASAAEKGRRALLLDLDLQFGDTAIMLGLEPRKTLHDLMSDPGELDADKLTAYATRHPSGLDVLPAPLRPEDAERVSEERVAQLLDVARTVYDAIVVDTSPYFHGPMLATLDRTQDLLLLCAPDVPTLKNLRLTLHTLELLHFPAERVRVVLNRVDGRIGLRARDVGPVLGRRVDFHLPLDPSVVFAANHGVPAATAMPGTPYARAFAAMVAELDGEPSGGSASSLRVRLRMPRLAFAGGH